MKRIAAALIFVLLLPCCSVQQNVNTPLLIKRFCEKAKLEKDETGIFYDNNNGRCGLLSDDGNALMLSTFIAGKETEQVNGAEITIDFDGEWSKSQRLVFINACESLIEVFAFEDAENAAQITENLFYNEDGKSIYKFHDTDRYAYSLIKTNVGADFCCKSKRLSSDKNTELTLSTPGGVK